MKGFDVLHVKSAVKNRNKFDLSRTHLTTMDFGQIVPLMVEETVPGDKISVGADFFSRTAPLVKPTFGKFAFKTLTGFVPYHQIAYDAEAFFAGKTSFEGSLVHQRYFTFYDLHTFIVSYCTTTVGATEENADYIYIAAGSTDLTYCRFTNVGRYYVKVLNSLGYALPQGVDYRTGSTWRTKVALQKLSAYPLLAYFKLYNDYLSQSTLYNTSSLSAFLQSVKYGKNVSSQYAANTGEILPAGMYVMFNQLKLNYSSDYFTSAWQQPSYPLTGESIQDVGINNTINGEHLLFEPEGTILDGTVSYDNNTYWSHISQRALDWLRSFDDWVRRNSYSGSRVVQQIFSRFGIKTDDYKTHYAHVYKTDVMPVQVGDVTSVAGTEDATLGDYAGKAIMNGFTGFDGDFSDYGLFMILGFMTIEPMNSYGFDRRVLRVNPLDYYNPEFDGLGADPISVGEFFASPIGDPADETLDTDVFGFTERYNAYRYGRDVITGDFRNYHSSSEMNTWHTGRLLDYVRSQGNLLAQAASVNTMPQTDSEYNRIFSVVSGDVDHFYLTCRFKVSAIRPMLNLNQVVKLGEGDTIVPRNGEVIS